MIEFVSKSNKKKMHSISKSTGYVMQIIITVLLFFFQRERTTCHVRKCIVSFKNPIIMVTMHAQRSFANPLLFPISLYCKDLNVFQIGKINNPENFKKISQKVEDIAQNFYP